MEAFRVLTAAEQVGKHLRAELYRGAWGGRMPGGSRLALDLGVGSDTVEAALKLLEQEGLLVPQGAGRRRQIVLPESRILRPLRLAILLLDSPAAELADGYMTELLYQLGEAGHSVFFADKYMTELGMDLKRITRLVQNTQADAWVVSSGSRELLEWFATQPVPIFALFGRRGGLPIAAVGPDKVSAQALVTRRLLELGHRRIVTLVRRIRRHPLPGSSERAILEEMAAHGIHTSSYNLPDWEETSAGFQSCLAELFRVTPPTALIIDEAPFLVAALQFLGYQNLRVPNDVSLVCTDDNPAFAWCNPAVAHIHWNSRPVVQRVVRWAANVSRGKHDIRQTLTPAQFIESGTIGPAKRSKEA